jgi:hypothetical protein
MIQDFIAEVESIGLFNGCSLLLRPLINNKYDFLQHFLNFLAQF